MRIKNFLLIFFLGAILLLTCPACNPDESNGNSNPFDDQELPTEVPDLIALLKEPNQAGANEIIASLAAKGAEAVPALIGVLSDDEESVRIRAVHTLALIGTPAVPDLITGLDSGEYRVRMGIADALGEIGPDAEEAKDRLMDVFASTTISEQKNIMYTLVKITDNPTVIGMIHAALRVDDLRYDALRVLGEWGPAAASAVPNMLQYLEVNYSSARIATIQALVSIGPVEGVVEGIAGRLVDTDLQVRDEAAKALGELGIAAVSATGALIDALAVEETGIQRTMIHSLGLMAPESREAIEPLTGYLGSEDPQIRRKTAWALGQFGNEASSALPVLREMAESDEFEYVRLEAAGAIELIEGDTTE